MQLTLLPLLLLLLVQGGLLLRAGRRWYRRHKGRLHLLVRRQLLWVLVLL